jgi:hypothetical protein
MRNKKLHGQLKQKKKDEVLCSVRDMIVLEEIGIMYNWY